MKIRIYKLARDFGVPEKAVLQALESRGRRIRSAFHAVDGAEVDGIRAALLDLGHLAPTEEEQVAAEPVAAEQAAAPAAPSAEAAAAAAKAAPAATAATATATATANAEAPAAENPAASATAATAAGPVTTDSGPLGPTLPPQAPARLGTIIERAKDRRETGKPSPTKERERTKPGAAAQPARRPTLTRERREELAARADQRGSAWRRPDRRSHRPGGRGGPRTGRRSAPKPIVRPERIEVELPISLKDLSALMCVRVPELMAKLMAMGTPVTINTSLPQEAVELLGVEFGIEIAAKAEQDVEEQVDELYLTQDEKKETGEAVSRPPVVTVLGHVDHGKTSLLDRIRKANVASGEAGGITQHIGAYQVRLDGDRVITFIDTPGHEAFTKMRGRGANVTDLVVLVVAADDSVMPQTEESIAHARAAGVPIVVAINKIDKANANVDKVKGDLAGLNVTPPEWGGENEMVPVSATTGEGIDKLLETIYLVSELADHKSVADKPASGTVLEAKLDEGRGVVAHLLVQEGTLKRGDQILSGGGHGKVRAIYDDNGKMIAEAGPSTPVEVLGLSETPEAGERFHVLHDQEQLRKIAGDRQRRKRERELAARNNITLENLFQHIEDQNIREVNVVLKCDVKGSLEVLKKALEDLATGEVRIRILHSAVGGITESDVGLAVASNAIVIGFNAVPDDRARTLAEERGVDIRLYQVIYNLIDDMKKALEGQLEPELKEVALGQLVVRQTFKISALGMIAGCYVERGKIQRNSRVRLIRDGIIIYEGDLASLRRFKDDVKEVKEGFECGVKIKDYDDLKEGDRIDAFEIQKIARTLESSSSSSS